MDPAIFWRLEESFPLEDAQLSGSNWDFFWGMQIMLLVVPPGFFPRKKP
jgi:hypothetical protein